MEIFEVVGYKEIDYFSKKNNCQVTGTNVYLVAMSPEKGVVGMQVREVYISRSKSIYRAQMGDHVRLIYNRFGRVEDMAVVDDA